ncbi:helix-turn-helix domain-containing protein [Pseudoxanthomonas sp. z9]|uniref:helix-turn-helix domain-containing protein n=1 Tax=Pseudoxanthomonas sp. z9 TaxID=2584942 RepID=UPI001142A1C3|nr:helix-turn-helix domain-containing protein [Pseudoxanthomonas sp. z9]
MDALITAAARALAAGDALGALKGVALREDPPALALRGIAMAQLGEHPHARELLRRAARGFGAREPLPRARCVVAEAEVALAMRDLDATPRALENAVATLEAQADHVNASQARLVLARRQLLLGRLDATAATLAVLARGRLSPALAAIAQLVRAELALRGLRTGAARTALERADEAALHAGIPALRAEVADARSLLARPAARRRHAEGEQSLRLDEVETLLASGALVIDACRRGLRRDGAWYPLARRPVLFALARVLAEAWPGDASREHLIEQAFRTRVPDETHRARLRVELGRLRALAAPLARIEATARGFALIPHDAREVALLVPPLESGQAELLALLADGAAWSTSALALALDTSQRTVQRALAELEADGRVRAIGRARARRWVAPPLTGFTTILLLPATLPAG